ncbi:1-acylglycerol-3-phosphate O-acyltransferase [Entomortierella beljakovae]|nr:1-acylglycerol-3-phosphate O-acyltransferase [Entomortierella beljakovae]
MSIVSKYAGNALIAGAAYVTLPRIIEALPQRTKFIIKYIVFFVSIAGSSVIGCIISMYCAAVGKRHLSNHLSARLFYHVASNPCGMKFKIEQGTVDYLKTTPAIVIANHQSNMDVIAMGRVLPKNCAAMVKKDLLYVPFLNLFLKMANVVFVDRTSSQTAVQAAKEAIVGMKKNNSGIWIFPEGTRSHFDKPGLLPFKKGAFYLAIQSQYPILPIVIEPYSHLYSSASQSYPGGEARIRVLPPISTVGMTLKDVDYLKDYTRNLMLKHVHDLAGEPMPEDHPLPPVPQVTEGGANEVRPRL